MRLLDLDPCVSDTPNGCDAAFNFRCPLCGRGRVSVWLVLGAQREGVHAHATTALPPAWDSMTISPSIAAEGRCTRTNRGCPGWHGHIVNGEVRP